jgi:hypothetical protein
MGSKAGAHMRFYVSKIQGHFSPAPHFAAARCLWCNQRALVFESGVLELRFRWGRTIDQKWPQCLGCCVRHHHITATSMVCADDIKLLRENKYRKEKHRSCIRC